MMPIKFRTGYGKIMSKQASSQVVSLMGKDTNNLLRTESDYSLWVNSHAYNMVKNVHMSEVYAAS
jgi:hypothetical protein